MSFSIAFMVVSIVLITTLGRIYMAKNGLASRRNRDGHGLAPQPDPDGERMREEIRTLKERIVVLERLATDTNSAVALDREIEKLR